MDTYTLTNTYYARTHYLADALPDYETEEEFHKAILRYELAGLQRENAAEAFAGVKYSQWIPAGAIYSARGEQRWHGRMNNMLQNARGDGMRFGLKGLRCCAKMHRPWVDVWRQAT
jgi:folylpolyglutamate synthase/dihydropteroate synthase